MKTLKDIVADEKLVEKLNHAFSDLRADFELDLDTSKDNIEKLLKTHVNVKENLELLTSISKSSSGVLQGLRGTGKTHLMLLARHNINKNIIESKNFCVYINLKRFSTIEDPSADIFNRSFAANIFSNIIDQLTIEIESKEKSGWLTRLFQKNASEKNDFIDRIESAILVSENAAQASLSGNSEIEYLGEYKTKITEKSQAAKIAIGEARARASCTSASTSASYQKQTENRSSNQKSSQHLSTSFLDIKKVHDSLKNLIKVLGVDSITLFFDEWEKLYGIGNFQKNAATFINAIIDTPIYSWIAYVPYRGELSPLSSGGDLQHTIDLDTDLIIERSKSDRQNCISYFTDFINRRLSISLDDPEINCKTLINTNKKMELLILGSMGNTRDFGTIFLKAWQNFKGYRQGKLKQGKPYQYISEAHIKEAIKADGKKKLQNIQNDAGALMVWNNVIDYISSKRHSHFAILETAKSREALAEREFSELFYQRLLHVRKTGVEPKESSVKNKLTILAPSYSVTYDHHSKISYTKDSRVIDTRIRRYIYNPAEIIKNIRIHEGKIHPCISCDNNIDAGKMRHAWEQNSCPFCGGKIYNE